MKESSADDMTAGSVSSESGFSLLELLIASLLSVFVVGGVLMMLTSLEEVH